MTHSPNKFKVSYHSNDATHYANYQLGNKGSADIVLWISGNEPLSNVYTIAIDNGQPSEGGRGVTPIHLCIRVRD